jgi:hypothetical protein
VPYRQRRRRPISRAAKITIELILSAVLTAAVGVGLLAWRLSTGPISLNFLTPMIEQALDVGQEGVSVHVEETTLEWTGGSGALPELRVHGLHVLSAQGDLIGEAPSAAIRLSIAALLTGHLAPARIDLIAPQITLERSVDGIRLRHTGGGTDAGAERNARGAIVALLLPELGREGEIGGMLREMAQVGVIGASLTLEDRVTGRTWFAPNTDIVIARAPGGLRAEIAVNLEVAGRVARIEGTAVLAQATGLVDLSIMFPRLDAGMVAMTDPVLARVALLHAEIGGRIDMTVDIARGVRAIRVDLATGPGLIVDPAVFPEPIGFASVRLRAQSTNDLAQVAFEAALQDVMGASVTASGRIDDATTAPLLTLHGEARNVAADDLKLLWPLNAGTGARAWSTTNLSDGRVELATLELVARAPGIVSWGPQSGEVTIQRLDARMRFTNLTVNYRSPMTPVRGVNGTARFSQSRAVFDLTSGSALGLRVESGQVVLAGIDEPGSTAAIDLNLRGPLRDALVLIDSPPLGLMRRINRPPGDFSGTAAGRLQVRFPLIQTLTFDEVQVAASGSVGNFQMRHVALEQDVRGGTVGFQVDDRALQVSGQVLFGPVQAEVELTHNFLPTAPFLMRTRARRAGDSQRPDEFASRSAGPGWRAATIAADVLVTMNRNGATRS